MPFLCLDEPYDIHGDFNTISTDNLMIVFELCTLEKRNVTIGEKCKSQEEIE